MTAVGRNLHFTLYILYKLKTSLKVSWSRILSKIIIPFKQILKYFLKDSLSTSNAHFFKKVGSIIGYEKMNAPTI